MVRYPSDEGSGHERGDLLLFLGILALSAVLLSLPTSRQTAVADLLRRSVLRPFVEAHRWVDRQADLRQRLQRLERQNRELQKRLLRREGVARENRELRDLLSLALPRGGEFASADLMVGTPRLSRAGRFLVDAGRAHGVEAPAGVVVARGIVGIVRTAEEERSYGDLWTHPDFRVSVRTDTGSVTGVVRPVTAEQGGTTMLFEGAPYQRRVSEGTLLLTTGAGGVFPPGVPVGRVRGVSSVESGWSRSYRVEPAVMPGTVRSVLVWLRPAGAGAADTSLRPGERIAGPAAADTTPDPDSTVAPPAPSESAAARIRPDTAGERQ